MNSSITEQFNFRKEPRKYASSEHAVLLLKPEFNSEHISVTEKYLKEHNLSTVWHNEILLSLQDTLIIYNDIFRFGNNDLMFGIDWKKRKAQYMQSDPCLIYIVKGHNAQKVCENLKYSLRERYQKLSIPDSKLNKKEFDELVIKNIIHVVDSHDTEVVLWLIEQLQFQKLPQDNHQ